MAAHGISLSEGRSPGNLLCRSGKSRWPPAGFEGAGPEAEFLAERFATPLDGHHTAATDGVERVLGREPTHFSDIVSEPPGTVPGRAEPERRTPPTGPAEYTPCTPTER
ncbi:hypothetical protein [Streptomyces sp. NPDC026589]|uniref:hypothetical protein n=1 Tax=Streptomyces sp. NPDC026589 TaxID=3155609 RepID=UPI0033C2F5EB